MANTGHLNHIEMESALPLKADINLVIIKVLLARSNMAKEELDNRPSANRGLSCMMHNSRAFNIS